VTPDRLEESDAIALPPAVLLSDRFELQELLGAGHFALVHLARDLSRQQRVAVKLLPRGSPAQEAIAAAHVAVERRLHRDVHDSNVLRTLEVIDCAVYHHSSGDDGGGLLSGDGGARGVVHAAIVMELAEGGQLFDYLQYGGGFDERLTRSCGQQLVSGLLACHSAGHAHYGLRPESLLLDADFELKVADCGIGRAVRRSADGVKQTRSSTALYMAPEVNTAAQSGATYDGMLADCWSVGVVLFMLAAGHPPYAQGSVSDPLFRLLHSADFAAFWAYHRQFGFAVSEQLQELLTGLLQVNPDCRLSMAKASEHPWLQGEKLSPQSLQKVMAGRQQSMRNPQVVRDAAQQAHARLEQQQQRLSEDAGAEELEPCDSCSPQQRDVDSGLVQPPPLLAPTLGVVPLPRAAAPRRAVSVLSSSATVEILLPVYDPERTVATTTTLFSRLPVGQLKKELMTLLLLNHFLTTSDDEQRSLIASITTPSGLVRMRLQLWREEGGEQHGRVRIEFRRLQGDSAQFRQLFADLVLQMEDIIVSE
jgi:serine/threonine protein kinase